MKITVISPGIQKPGSPYYDLWQSYNRRMQWSVDLVEIDPRKSKDPNQDILDKLSPAGYIIALDERGKTFSSRDFAKKCEDIQISHQGQVQFLIGEAEGLSHAVKDKAHMLMSFGQQTWPHMMVRTMLIEQLYRAQQILSGHPYHKD